MMTPYKKLKSLPEAHTLIKAGLDFKQLDEIACNISDNEAAKQLKEAKQQRYQHHH